MVLVNKLDQALAQITDMQTEIESLKQQKGTATHTITETKDYCWSHGLTNTASCTSSNCFNKNLSIKIGLYLKENGEEYK